ncbi:MAG TPA: polyphenol oxidase family protein [Thermoanaerobaculia bacterium]|nr:polyphenol oxidase family protein [Thermoanaerobaculia bacterium]
MWPIEQTPLGRVAVAPDAPVFCTSLDYDGKIREELTRFVSERFGIDTVLSTCTQVHGVNVERAAGGENPRACDAMWSDRRGVSIGIKIADCLPVTMLDPTRFIIANIHSGWRSAAAQITSQTLDALARSSSFDPSTARAYLGPSIRVCCFEVGEEVAAQFDEPFIDRTHAKPHVDLVAMTRTTLRARGFADENISDSELCTRCEGSIFHSYRRDGTGGRNLQVVAQ